MPSRRHFLIGGSAAVAGCLVLPGLAGSALAEPAPGTPEAASQAAADAFARERMDRQSPINIRTNAVETPPSPPTLVIDYPTSTNLDLKYIRRDGTANNDPGCGIRNQEETVEALNFSRPANVRLDGERYELLQFHFHTPSEHRIDGDSFPIEQHFVHQRVSDGKLLVVGVFLRRGGTGTVQDRVLANLPRECGPQLSLTNVNLRRSFPDVLESYTYGGSLTTDPFSQGVRWHVIRRPVQVQDDTINRFQRLFPASNSRPTQDQNGRTVRLFPGRLA